MKQSLWEICCQTKTSCQIVIINRSTQLNFKLFVKSILEQETTLTKTKTFASTKERERGKKKEIKIINT